MRGWEKRDTDGAGAARAASQDRVARWLDALLLHTSGVEAPVDIAISHAAVDQSRRMIRSYRVATVPPEAGDLYALAEEIAETIALDAEDLGGHQRYQLVARCNGQEVGSTTVRFVIDAMPPAVDSEPANASGLVSQAQRHTEAAMRLMVQSQGAVVASLTKRLSDQEALIERMHQRQADLLVQQDDLLRQRAMLNADAEDRRLANELLVAKEAAELERKSKVWTEGVSMVKFLLPVVVQYLMAEKKTAAGPELNGVLTDEFLTTFTDEQLAYVCQRLPPEVVEQFLTKVKEARRAATAATASTKAGPSPPADPAPSAAESLKPLEGEAKLGAAKLLQRDLLPKVVARYRSKAPLVDPATDDPFHHKLLRRLIASSSALEMQAILSLLQGDERLALVALCRELQLEVSGLYGKDEP